MIAKRIDNIFDIVFSILLFSLSVSMAVPNILLGVLLLLLVFKKHQVAVSKKYIILVVLFVFYFLLKAFVFNNLIENIPLYKHLITLPILCYLIFNIRDITIVLKGYVFGVFCAVLISVSKIIFYFLKYKTLPFGNTAEVQDLIIVHRPYFGFMCLLAIILIDYLLFKIKLKYIKVVYLLIAILIAVFLYVIVARLSLFLLSVYVIIRIVVRLKLSKTKLIMGLLVLLTIVIGAFNLNKNIKNRFHIKKSFSETIKVLENQEPRFVIWNCTFNQMKEEKKSFFGYENRKEIQEKLNKCYGSTISNESKRDYFLVTKFNTHNQFFDIFLGGGLVGLSLFLAILFYSTYSFSNNFYALFSLFSFFLFFVVENLFHRQLGVYLVGVFIPLFYKMIVLKKE